MTILFSRQRGRNRLHSFTLVELLAVMAIGSILAVLSLSAYNQIVRSQTVSTSALMITGALDMARQSAITRNSYVEFRLYQLPEYNDASPTTDPLLTTGYRAFQTFLVTDDATTPLTPLTQVSFLPDPAIISSNTANSSLAAITAVAGTTTKGSTAVGTAQPIPTYLDNYKTLVFDFSPTGGLEPAGGLTVASEWYMTVVMENDAPDPSSATGLPKNFVTIQVDPFTGRAKKFQP